MTQEECGITSDMTSQYTLIQEECPDILYEITQITPKIVPALMTYSQECSDVYGDAIHLARAMTNTVDPAYYDSYDDCIESTEVRSRRFDMGEDIIVHPNPTTGMINIDLPQGYVGQLDLYGINGQKFMSYYIDDSDLKSIDISDNKGMVLLRFTNQQGAVIIKRVLVIK